MTALNALVPKFLRKDIDMPDDYMPPPPQVAALPEFNTHDEESLLMQRAAALHAQLRRNIEAAQIELAETVLGRQGDQQKIGYLEKENAELRLDIAQLQNTIATLQSDNLRYQNFFSLRLQINEKERAVLTSFGIKAPPKKKSKARPKKFDVTKPPSNPMGESAGEKPKSEPPIDG